MVAAVRSSAATATSASLVLPAGIVSGDIILVYLAQYSTMPTLPTGYTSLGSVTATGGSYNEPAIYGYKVANGTEGGTTITATLAYANSYACFIAVVVSGAKAQAPGVAALGTSATSQSFPTGSLTVASTDLLVACFSEMTSANSAVTATAPAATTTLQSVANTTYHFGLAVSKTGVSGSQSLTATSNSTGSGEGVLFQFVTSNATLSRTATDATTTTDSISSGLFRRVPDTVTTPTDTAQRQVVLVRTTGDAGVTYQNTTSGSLVRRPVGLVFSYRSPLVAETATANKIRQATTSDSLSITDTGSRFAILVRTASDSAPASDQDVRQTSFFRSAIDTVALPTDATLRSGVFTRGPPDSAPASDVSATRTGTFVRNTGSSPTSIPNLVSWLDSSRIPDPVGKVITSLPSGASSGVGWVAPAAGGLTLAAGGINGWQYLSQNANGQSLNWDVNLSAGDSTVFVAARMRGTNNQRITSGLHNNWLLGWWANRSTVHYAEGWVYLDGPATVTPSATTLQTYAGVRRAGTSLFYAGGTNLGSGGGSQGPNGLTTSGYTNNSEFSDADVYEVIVYDRALTPAEIAQTFAYLNVKYSAVTPSVETFSALPADITISGAPVGIDTTYGNPGSSLKGTGAGDWWYFTGSRFQVSGDFDITYDLNINPDGSGGRDIANFGFWINTPGAGANGFMYRLENGAYFNNSWFQVTSGGHGGGLAGGVDRVDVGGMQVGVWLRTRLTATGTLVRAVTTRLDTGVVLRDTSIDLAPYLDATHTRSGTFGQKQDGAGSAIGHRWDNISLNQDLSDILRVSDATSRAGVFVRSLSDSTATSDTATATALHFRKAFDVVDTPGSYPPVVNADAPMALFQFDTAAALGSVATGSAANTAPGRSAYPGTFGGSPRVSPGLTGSTPALDVTAGYVNVPDLGMVTTDGTFNTVEAWFIHNGGGGWSMIVGWTGYDLSIQNDGRVGINTGNSDYWASAAGQFAIGQRTHVVAWMSNGNPQATRIWVNGVEVALSQYQATTPTTGYRTAGPARISSWNSDLSYFFQGVVDSVAIFQGALPPNRILAHYQAPSTNEASSRAAGVFVRSPVDTLTTTDSGIGLRAKFMAVADSAPVSSDVAVRSAGIFARTPVDAYLPTMTWNIDANNPMSDTGVDPIRDLDGTFPMVLTSGSREVLAGVKEWNLDGGGYLDQSGAVGYVLGQNHTVWAWVNWRAADPGWRTVLRGDNDHWIIVQDGSKRLGMYSNRNGGFFPSGFNIDPTSGWNLVVAVGYGDTPTATTGRTDFFINGALVGSVPRVSSGTTSSRIGWPGQGPGKIASSGAFATTALTPAQVQDLYDRSKISFGYADKDTAARQVVFTRSGTDTVTPTDSATRVDLAARSGSDSISTLSETAVRSAGIFVRSVSESTSASDSAVRRTFDPRATTEIITPTDLATRSGVFTRQAGADSAPASDVDVRQTLFFRSAADTVATPTDAAVRSVGIFARTQFDGMGVVYRWYVNPVAAYGNDAASLSAFYTNTGNSIYSGTGAHTAPISFHDAAPDGTYFQTTKPAYLPADNYAWVAEGFISIPVDGTYGFMVDSDDASDLFVNDVPVGSWYGGHGFAGNFDPTNVPSRNSSISLTQGLYRFRARFQENAGGDGIVIGWKPPGQGAFSNIPISQLIGIAEYGVRVGTFSRAQSEATSTSDSSSRYLVAPRTGSDNVPVTDSAVRALVLPRTTTDAAPVAEAPSSTATHPRNASDAVSLSDGAVRASGIFTRNLTDSTSTSDATTRNGSVFPRSTKDLAARQDTRHYGGLVQRPVHEVLSTTGGGFIGDVVSWNYVTGRYASDTITSSDVVSRAVVQGRVASDATACSDATLRILSALRTGSETTSTSDSGVRVSTYQRIAADSSPAADTLAQTAHRIRTSTDTSTSTDAVARSTSYTRVLTPDSAPASDVDVRQTLFFRGVAEAVTPTDSATRSSGVFVRSLTETTTVTDAARRVDQAFRTTTEATTSTDAASRAVLSLRQSTDVTGAVSDSASRTLGTVRSATDSIAVSDAGSRLLLPVRSTADTASATDSPGGVRNFTRTALDTLAVSDTLARQVVYARTLTDTVPTPTDAARQTGFSRAGADSITGVTDAATRALLGLRSASDTLTITDIVTRSTTVTRSATDRALPSSAQAGMVRRLVSPVFSTAFPSDQAVGVSLHLRTGSDALVAPSDALQRGSSIFGRTSDDTAPALDLVGSPHFNPRVASDPLTLTDAVTRTGTFARTLSDSLTISDSLAAPRLVVRTGSETVAAVTDVVVRAATYLRVPSDSAPASDTDIRQTGFYRSTVDTLGTTDAVARTSSYLRVTSESTPVTDAVVSPSLHLRTGVDSTATTEVVTRFIALSRTGQDDDTQQIFPARSLVQRPVHPVSLVGTPTVPFDQDTTRLSSGRVVTDFAPATDSSTRPAILFQRAAADTVPTPTDTTARVALYSRLLRDATSLVPQVARGLVQGLVMPVGRFSEGDRYDDALRTTYYFRRLAVDTGLAADSVLSGSLHYRTATDSTSTSDVVNSLTLHYRTTSEVLATGDSVTSPRLAPRSLNDSATPTESTVRTTQYTRALTEFLTTSDFVGAVPPVHGYDTLPAPNEVLTRQASYVRQVAETPVSIPVRTSGLVQRIVHPVPADVPYLVVTDGASRALVFPRIASDAVAGSDATSSFTLHVRTVSETTSVSDALVRHVNYARVPSDAATAADTDVRQTGFFRTGSDTVTPTDTATRAPTLWLRTAIDSAPANATVSSVPPGHTSDNAPATDSTTRSVRFARSTSDTTPMGESGTALTVLYRSASEIAPAVDVATSATTRPRTTTDTSPVTDTATRQVIAPRAASETLALPTDTGIRVGTFGRVCTESLSCSDTALRQFQAYRSGADLVTVLDSLVDYRLLIATCYHILPIPQDSLASPRLVVRTGSETAPVADALISAQSLGRLTSDTTSADDLATRRDLLFRSNPRSPSLITDYYDPPLDSGVRVIFALRGVEDMVPANDQAPVRYEIHPRTGLDGVAVPFEAATTTRLLIRSTTDVVLPSTDSASRIQRMVRSSADAIQVPAEVALRVLLSLRTATDAPVTPTDLATRALLGLRSGLDVTLTADVASRQARMTRLFTEATTTTDSARLTHLVVRLAQDLLPNPSDGARRYVTRARVATDRVLTPLAQAWWLQAHRITFGPPIATITAVSKVKVGNTPGCDTMTVSFTFNQPVDAWVVRVNSQSPFDGNPVASFTGHHPGFGLEAFGRYPFGRAAASGEWTTAGTATISANLLLHGANDVTVYGRSLTGLWSVHSPGPV